MFELRILSGLHRGATLPLDERILVIGADDDADVVLVDPGIETRHATLTLNGDGWRLAALDGAVLGAAHNQPCTALDLQPGEAARLGHVWLSVTEAGSAWENPPPEPADSDADVYPDADTASDDDPAYAQAEAELEDNEPYRDSPLDDPQTAPEPEPAPAPPVVARPAPPKAARRTGWRRSKAVLVPLVMVTILSACAAYTMNSHGEGDTVADKADARSATKAKGALAAVPAPKPSPKAGQAELREAFRARLKEVDLLKRFKLDLKDRDWTMQAFLDDEEAARFERILKAFIQTHDIKFPVNAKVGSAEVMLPFRIREVISGANASLVTQDGQRLYIGDEHRGVRLVAIDGRHLQFDGERKIKVTW